MVSLILIGVSLSIDAFTLATTYGLLNPPRKYMYITSLSVGIFHFFMPLLGNIFGKCLNSYLNINSKFLLIIVLLLILIEYIKSLNDEYKEIHFSMLSIILFSFSVSIDSFSLGIGINYITGNTLLASITFSIISCFFTFLGFKIGKHISEKSQKIATITAITIIFTLIIYFLCKG